MYTLYIDTHALDIVLALFKNEELICTKKMASNRHSTYTLNLLQELLNENNLTIPEISSIIVINGPGSFTGVRLSVTIAKIIGYTKNIALKPISYLQAVALSYDLPVTVGLSDKNGVFLAHFNESHELIGDYTYISNREFANLNTPVILDETANLNLVYQYLINQEPVNPHLLKPLYVKKIEVEKC